MGIPLLGAGGVTGNAFVFHTSQMKLSLTVHSAPTNAILYVFDVIEMDFFVCKGNTKMY